MDIWVDADACPVAIREIIAKAAHKRAMTATFVANHAFSLLSSPHVRLYQVPGGFDEADKAIEQRVSAGDLVTAPSARNVSAMPQAIDLSLARPMIRPRFPVISPIGLSPIENYI